MRWFVFLALAAAVSWATPPAAKKPSTAKRSVKGRTVKGRTKKKAAGPSYQLHPDAQRYTEIQKALSDRGYFKGDANGEWKDDSTDALRRFQADQKLPNDGKISALSLSALGLGPKHDGTTASTVPPPTADEPPAPPNR